MLLAFIALSAFSISVKASDTLTIAQVYNFSVGDTFDYQYYTQENDVLIFEYNFVRLVVIQKTYSAGNDTLHYYFGSPGGNITDSLMLTTLDSSAIFKLTNAQNCAPPVYTFNDGITYPGFNSNVLSKNCGGYTDTVIVTAGLGETYYSYYSQGGGGSGLNRVSRKLIYYHKTSGASGGVPYYIADGSTIAYVPLPETCASWTKTLANSYNGAPGIVEEIRTGNRFPKNGHNYVELICRIENYINSRFTRDSLIGYFYNDSLAKTAFFVNDTNSSSPLVLCAFNNLYGQQCSSEGYYTIDSVLIGNTPRTRWTCYPLGVGDPNQTMIAGVGYITGLIQINTIYSQGYPEDGELTCFSVCGQTLYPTGATGDCVLLTSIKGIDENAFTLNLFPTLASTYIHIEASVSNGLRYNIYDTNGQLVSTRADNTNLEEINISGLADGLYLIQFVNNSYTISRRFVVVH